MTVTESIVSGAERDGLGLANADAADGTDAGPGAALRGPEGRECRCGCGQPAVTRPGYARSCHRRWVAAGRPESGPPEPWLRADAYEVIWAAGARERRIDRARPLAAALIRSVDASDRKGIGLVLARVVFTGLWREVMVVLAECRDLGRAAVVTGCAWLAPTPGAEGQEDAA